MKLTFLGVLSAFMVGNNAFQSNMLLESDKGTYMLIDCGSDVRHSLYALHYSFVDIDAVYISHLHADHIGGLEWFGFSKKFNQQKKPLLFIANDLRASLWKALSGGMCSLEEEAATLASFFELPPIVRRKFCWETHSFELIKVPHMYACHRLMPSYGLKIVGKEKSVFISTDTRFAKDELMPVYETSDIIFQDCEISEKPTKQHARYLELKTLPRHIKQKMWLYDYQEGPLPDAKADGFLGFVVRGQLFEWN